MLGAKDGKGGFFPEGIAGRINTPEGFDNLASGLDDWEGKQEAKQVGSALAGQTLKVPCVSTVPCCHLLDSID